MYINWIGYFGSPIMIIYRIVIIDAYQDQVRGYAIPFYSLRFYPC